MKVTIAEICTIRSGKRLPKGSDFANEVTQYPYIRARDIKAGRIGGEDLAYLTEEVHKKISRYIVNTNDVVITIVGASVGDVALVTEQFDGFNLTENAVRLTEFKDYVNPVYVSYVLNSKSYWELMQQIAGGSAQPKLGIYKIESIPLELPAIETQDRIVDILSAYDNLIENNQKQIKLLEEAAQRLYKEWFVDLRFPGWESAEIVDGVPVGWKKVQLSEICSVLRRGISPNYNEKGKYQVINQKCIRTSIMDMSESRRQEKTYANELNLQDTDTVICSTGTGTLGRVGQVFGKHENTTFDSHVTLVRSHENHNFIYQAIKYQQPYLMSMGRGSTNQQELYRGVIEALEIIIPTEDIITSFETLASAIHNKITVLVEQIDRLTFARDRLLPKLMNGELEV